MDGHAFARLTGQTIRPVATPYLSEDLIGVSLRTQSLFLSTTTSWQVVPSDAT